MAKAQDWNYYSENSDGTRNEEGSRFTARPSSQTCWMHLQELLDNDDDVVAVGYEKANKEEAGQQSVRISKAN